MIDNRICLYKICKVSFRWIEDYSLSLSQGMILFSSSVKKLNDILPVLKNLSHDPEWKVPLHLYSITHCILASSHVCILLYSTYRMCLLLLNQLLLLLMLY